MSAPGPIFLYVGPDAADPSPVLSRLRADGAAVGTISDVYLALARWGRGAVNPAAVIVCVDSFQPEEFEFFRLAARDHGRTPVYVCACPQAAAKLDQAVRAGARGIVTAHDVDALLADVAHSWEESAATARAAVTSAPTDHEDIVELGLIPDSAPPDTGAGEAEDDIDDETLTDEDAAECTGAARVPWKSYRDRPVRTPPGRADAAPPPAAEPPEGVLDGPLLTAEELEALMREDFRTLDRESDPLDRSRRPLDRDSSMLDRESLLGPDEPTDEGKRP